MKMKKKIHINLKLIAIILLLITGSFFLINNAGDMTDCENAVSFEDLKESDIKDGTYVSGYIDKYVVRTEMINDKPVKSAISQTVIDFQCDSDMYTIPFQDNKYIQLMARSKKAKNNLANMLDEPSEKAYFEGIIVKRSIGINEAWYGAVDKRTYPGINNIISDYYIREVDKGAFWNGIRIGAILVLLAILMFVDGGGFEGLIEETEIKPDIKNVNNLKYLDNKDDELINRESVLRQLTRRQKRIKKKKPSSIVMLVLGVISIVVSSKLVIISVTLILFGGKGFFEWFINSSNLHGIKLAKKIGYDSLYLMIEQCKRDIKELEELVYNEERDQGNS